MRASQVAAIAAILAVVFWALKAIVIWIAGGLDESPLEAPLFVLGLLSILIAFAATGFSLKPSANLAVRCGLAVAGAAVALIMVVALAELGRLLPESTDWVQEEAGLWLASVLGAALILAWQRYSDKDTAIA